MLAVARNRVDAQNVTFQVEECQATSLGDGAFDTAFVSLVLHFTKPERMVDEMHRILARGGTLIVVNLDPLALRGLHRIRSLVRILYQGAVGYRLKPPKGFGRNVLSETQLCDLLVRRGFRILATETIRARSRSSNIPLEYVRALKT